ASGINKRPAADGGLGEFGIIGTNQGFASKFLGQDVKTQGIERIEQALFQREVERAVFKAGNFHKIRPEGGSARQLGRMAYIGGGNLLAVGPKSVAAQMNT